MKVVLTNIDATDKVMGYSVGQEIEVHKPRGGRWFLDAKGWRWDFCNFEILPEVEEDAIVERVLNQFRLRSKQGIETYGTTLQENNLSTLEWINEAQAEAMDFCLYLEKLKDKIKEYEGN